MYEDNDFLNIVSEIYSQTTKKCGTFADLSGWEFSPLALLPQGVIKEAPKLEDLNRYYADSGTRLDAFKEQLIPALENLEGCPVACADFTLLPSTTTGIAILLAYLKEEGVERVIVETPTYFAVVDAANRIGITCNFIPLLEQNNKKFATDINRLMDFLDSPRTCLWLHQPRYALGNNLCRVDLCSLADKINDGSYIVLDEANDDSVPAICAGLHNRKNIFRLRNLTKALGLNGVRSSFLFHSPAVRERIVDIMWSIGGALDWFSLSMTKALTTPPKLYADMLKQMHERLLHQRLFVISNLHGLNIQLLPGETGFLGSLRLDWRDLAGTESEKRQKLIHHFAAHQVPALLGSHIYMPKNIGFEHIRVNFLNTSETLRRGIDVVRSFFQL